MSIKYPVITFVFLAHKDDIFQKTWLLTDLWNMMAWIYCSVLKNVPSESLCSYRKSIHQFWRGLTWIEILPEYSFWLYLYLGEYCESWKIKRLSVFLLCNGCRSIPLNHYKSCPIKTNTFSKLSFLPEYSGAKKRLISMESKSRHI